MKHPVSFLCKLAFIIAFSLAGAVSWAEDEGSGSKDNYAKNQARIDAKRKSENARFDGEERDCYNHFVVNSCLHDVKMRRYAMLADLINQENQLHEEERRQQQQEAEQNRQERQKQHDQKVIDTGSSAAVKGDPSRKTTVPSGTKKDPVSPVKSQQPTKVEQATHRQEADQRQKALLERRKARDKKLKDSPSKVTPLPDTH